MSTSFLTYHGTFLCFGEAQADFRHVPLDRLDGAGLVVTDLGAAPLRAGIHDGRPVPIRPASAARVGLPRALGIGRGNRPSTVSLEWRDAHLCAGGGGGTVLQSSRIEAWEEFLPVASDDLVLLHALAERNWEWVRDRRPLAPGQVRLTTDFMLGVGDVTVDLRLMPSLGGEFALRDGRTSLLVDGWRIEGLRRYEPLIVWRHDGSQDADEEIVLGLRSQVLGGSVARLLVETRLEVSELRDRVPELGDIALEVRRPPEGRRGLLASPAVTGDDPVPVLYLANGVICRGGLDPLLRALAEERDLALLPWRWTAEAGASGDDMPSLFDHDPAEGADAVACSAAVIGVPNRRSSHLQTLISTIAANRLGSAATDAREDDLLRYVVARERGACTRLLRRFVQVGPGDRAGPAPALLNLRPVPAESRVSMMRALLEPSG